MDMKTKVQLLLVSGLFAVCACTGDPAPRPGGSGAEKAIAKGALVEKDHPAVERVVFIGKKEACECTRKQIDVSWQALQTAIEGGPAIAIKRLQVDVEVAEANRYNDIQPMMVLPGLYFFDGEKKLVKLLQGELRVDEIGEVLQ